MNPYRPCQWGRQGRQARRVEVAAAQTLSSAVLLVRLVHPRLLDAAASPAVLTKLFLERVA